MDLRHYDNVAHDLNASYEDVQEGMSTPYGIAAPLHSHLFHRKGMQEKKLLPMLLNHFQNREYCCPRRTIFMHSRLSAYGVFRTGVLLFVRG